MNRFPIFPVFVLALVMISASYADHHEDEVSTTELPEENKFADVDNKTMSTDDSWDMVMMMPSSDKAVMMINNGQPKVTCWVCSRPCSSIFCCNDGFPQCCSVNGRCGCCRY